MSLKFFTYVPLGDIHGHAAFELIRNSPCFADCFRNIANSFQRTLKDPSNVFGIAEWFFELQTKNVFTAHDQQGWPDFLAHGLIEK